MEQTDGDPPPSGAPTPVRLTLGHSTVFTNLPDGLIERYARDKLRIWSDFGSHTDAHLGIVIAGVGDLNGDGFADLLVGGRLPRADRGPNAVFLYTGSTAGLSFAFSATLKDPPVRAAFGMTVALAGDVNGDRKPDILVGAGRFSTVTQRSVGAAHLYLSAETLRSGAPDWRTLGERDMAYLGSSLASARDVNGDGFDDVIVGSRREALVFYGSADGLSSEPDWRASGNARDSMFGDSVAGPGDVNGDGYADVLVGSPGQDANVVDAGRAVLYYGGAGGLSSTPSWEYVGTIRNGSLGATVVGAGDLNSDGLPDIAVGAPGNQHSGPDPGRVLVFYGRREGLRTEPDWVWEGEQPKDLFGASIAAAGDVNGDGHDDLLVAAPLHSATCVYEGRVYVFLGGPSGLARQPVCTIDGGFQNKRYGTALAGVGDVDGDGLMDFAAGARRYEGVESAGAREIGRFDVFFGSRTAFQHARNALPFMPSTGIPRISLIRWVLGSILAAAAITLAAGLVLARRRERAAVHTERTRLARDLHDNIGPQLTVLQHIARGSPEGSPAGAQVELRDALKSMSEAVDRAIWGTKPENDRLESFVLFLAEYTSQLSTSTGVNCLNDFPLELPGWRLGRKHRENLWLILQEALTNAIKHAAATQIWVRIRTGEGSLELSVEDNGRGFDEQSEPKRRSFRGNGLVNMRHRVEELGGTIDIRTTPAQGTEVVVRVAIPSAA